MSIMDPEDFYDRYIAEDFETKYVPGIFEDVSTQYLIRKNRSRLMETPFDLIGKYYYDDPATKTNGEFDIVTHDPNGFISYEVKFRSDPVDNSLIEEEIRQVEMTGLNCYRYGFISRSGFTLDVKRDDLILIDLSEMYQ